MDYHSLSRKELQALCKKHGIRANTSNATMADALQSLNIEQDSATEIRICDEVILGNTGLNSPASVTTSCRRTPLRTSTRTMVRTTRSKRESEKAEEEEDLKSPAAGGIENVEEASRSVAPSGRRIMTRSSARRQTEKIEIAEELITPAKAAVPLVPNSRRRPTRVSARQQTLREGAGQEETKGEKEVIDKMRTLSLSSTICTRRSSRLRGKSQDSEAKQLEQNLERKFIDERGTKQPDAVGEPAQEISEELSGEPSVTIHEASSIEDSIRKISLQLVKTPAPVSEEYKGEPSVQTMTQVPGVNETAALLKQSDQNVGGVGECLIDAGVPLCSDEKTHEIPAATETSFPQQEASADETEKVIIDDVSASLGPDSDLSCINGEECNAPFPSLMGVHGELPSSEADQVALTTHGASTDAVMLSVEVSDEAQVGDQTTGTLGDIVKEKLQQADVEAGDGCIAQEASLDPVLLLSSEPENNVGEPLPSDEDSDNLPATEEVTQFPGTAVTSYEASTDATIMLSVEVPDETQVVDQTAEGLANLEKEKLLPEDAFEAVEGFIAQEASLNPVLLPGELLSPGKDSDNIPATEEVVQFPGTAVTSYEASTDAIMLSVEVPDEAQVVDQTAVGLANLEKEKLLPEDALEAVEGFIAQEATLNPVLLPGEPLSPGKDSDNIPAADEFLQFLGTASLQAWEVPSADLPHDAPVGELIATSAAVIPDGFLDELQQIEEINEKSASLGSWSAASPIPASLAIASSGPEFFVVPVADKSLQFPADALRRLQEVHSENTHHDSLAVDLTATTTAVPDEVSAACLQIEEANEKSPSFGSWSAASRGSEFSMVRKSGKSRSSVGKGKTLGRIQMFTSAEACVDKENKLMNDENIVADQRLNEKNVGLAEFKNFSLRKLRIMVKEGIKNKMSERTPLETLSANCLGNENSEIA
ncbi:uncharacterized protein LOC116265733 isoform X2 [Nymphaea colorata]|uniref:uncharacterized protein LOC116265733 isoform X2 n=1 Tax=Nymphaea colorata TaxID=210225 RepID=UPI00129EF723|nr:uncharacterized protein LOC116265733 isoform X2 [Nymphaea colorata]